MKDMQRYFVRRQFAVKSSFFRDHVTVDETGFLLRLYNGLDKLTYRGFVGDIGRA